MQPYLAVQGDACAMPFQDGIFDLILFSPPYGLHVDYPGSEDVDPEEWPDFLEKVAQECARVGKPNCRLAVNVPLDGSPRDNPKRGAALRCAPPLRGHGGGLPPQVDLPRDRHVERGQHLQVHSTRQYGLGQRATYRL